MKKIFLKKIKNKLRSSSGYTLLETIVAISIFLIIVTVGMGAVLNANMVHQKSQNMRSLLDNLSFVMEDISRNLRTGYDYHCIDDGNLLAYNPHSCANGTGISFKSQNGEQITYNFSSGVQKYVASGPATPLVPSEISIDPNSGFSVEGAESTDSASPFVTIRISGVITYKDLITPFSLQTSVAQRLIEAL